jgi:type I restriction enzyme, S subunit
MSLLSNPIGSTSNWQLRKLRSLAVKIGSGKTPRGGNEVYTDSGVMFLRSQNVYDDGLHLDDVVHIDLATDEEMRATRVRPQDVLLNITGASIGRTCLVPQVFPSANVNQHVCIIRLFEQVYPLFVSFSLKSTFVKDQIRAFENGSSREGLNFEQVGGLRIWLPPSRGIQRSVAESLARKTSAIDDLIADKQRMIALLHDKRQGLISQAVTRGLDPSVPMKVSGIEWLGKTPSHWQVCQLRRVLSFAEYGISDATDTEGSVVVLRMGDIQNGEISFDKVAFVQDVPDSMLLQTGDLLFNRTNSLEQIAKVGIFRGSDYQKVSFASYLVRLRTNNLCDPEYLNCLLNTPGLLAFARGQALPSINQANLNPTRYSEIKIPVPPLEEQQRILKVLKSEVGAIDQLASLNEEQIAKLREYRQTVISAAVTGQMEPGTDAA